jgi:hypothetical protein
LYDSFEFEFMVNGNNMIFRTDNNNTFFGENPKQMFVLIKIKRKTGDVYMTLIKHKAKPQVDNLKITIK